MRIGYAIALSFIVLMAGCRKEKEDGKNKSVNQKAVGESANGILSSNKYTQLTLEIFSVNGFELEPDVINATKAFLSERVNKPGGIVIKTSSISNPNLAPYSADDLKQLENNIRTEYNDVNEITLYLFIAEGSYTNNNVLGVAYQNTSMAIMGGRIRELTGGIGQPSENLVLNTVIQHEIAHLFGLVNVGSVMQSDHQDEVHGHHCDVENCLMYYAVESGDLVGNSQPPQLDAQCLADLKANGGK